MEVIEKAYFNRLLDLLDDINTKLEMLLPRDEKDIKQVLPSEEFEEIEKYRNFFVKYGIGNYAGWFINEEIHPMLVATRDKFGTEKLFDIVRIAEKDVNKSNKFNVKQYLYLQNCW